MCGVIIPALDPDQERIFSFLVLPDPESESRKNWNRYTYRGVMIRNLDPELEEDFQALDDSRSRFGSGIV